jgi:hypothetical protein
MKITKYELIEHPKGFHDKHWCVKLVEGEYSGVVYQYDTVKFEEDGSDVMLVFNTITIENPKKQDLTSEEFKSIIGPILTELVEEYLKRAEEQNEQNGTGDTETPTE